MILIVTGPQDVTADAVEACLRARGAASRRFDPADYPARARLSFALDARGRVEATLRTDGRCIALHELDAIWFRRPGRPQPDEALADERVRRYVAAECEQHLDDVWAALPVRCFPAPPLVLAHAALKATQLVRAGELGFELPATLFTTDEQALLDFHRANDGHVISKLAGPAFNRTFGPELARYTEPIAARDVGQLDAVRFAPAIYQAALDKRVELRVTVVGERVFAVEIHSQATRRTRGDWRRYDVAHTPHRPHALPAELEARCVALVRRLGLDYGAIDFVLTPDGRYVFLEINPNGQFLWLEQLTGLPIADAIAERLCAPRRRDQGAHE